MLEPTTRRRGSFPSSKLEISTMTKQKSLSGGCLSGKRNRKNVHTVHSRKLVTHSRKSVTHSRKIYSYPSINQPTTKLLQNSSSCHRVIIFITAKAKDGIGRRVDMQNSIQKYCCCLCTVKLGIVLYTSMHIE